MRKVEEVGRKLDEIRELLEDVFLTLDESVLLKGADEFVKNKRFSELKSLDEHRLYSSSP